MGFCFTNKSVVVLVVCLAAIVLVQAVPAQERDGDWGKGWSSDLITSVPRTMSYQGVLKDDQGNPMGNDTLSVIFKIFDVESGGSQLWAETDTIVTDNNGYFSATLGDSSSINLSFDVEYWLELEVDSEILSPRQKLNMSAYSARADTSDYTTYANNADMVDNIHASPSPQANQLLALDDSAMFPSSAIPPVSDADMVDGFHASDTPLPNTLLALDANAKFPNVALYMGHGGGLNADMVDTYHAGNSSGNVPISNGALNVNLHADVWDSHNWGDTYPYASNSDKLDGYHLSDLDGRYVNDNAGEVCWEDLCNPLYINSTFNIERTNAGKVLEIRNQSSGNVMCDALYLRTSNTTSTGNWTLYTYTKGGNALYASKACYNDGQYVAVINHCSGPTAPGLYINGYLTVTGSINSIVSTSRGREAVFGVESPELEIYSTGTGSLIDGVANVSFDRLFSEAVSDITPVGVVVTPIGSWSGLYVESVTKGGFVVRSGAGDQNVSFNWIATGRRAGFETRPFVSIPNEEEEQAIRVAKELELEGKIR